MNKILRVTLWTLKIISKSTNNMNSSLYSVFIKKDKREQFFQEIRVPLNVV